ncbi:probable E3 ubiquitin-protein ligase HERC4 isoform X2 [Strongylocentrotus purpuratus]|uniref:HECT-type E3 ubiquitin transferase n=1 Tax=Strongylocentrotus purpuratus TaxID=7668 RepID=A0A7M7PG32_STRPU|nr:probable E3 ubiquitin-protein ligase HERC4 isoform X2 [Strongylocentrotus purpuratus]
MMSGHGETLAGHRRPPVGPGAIRKKSIPTTCTTIDKGTGRLKLTRQLSTSQPKLEGSVRRGSLDSILIDGRARSNSLAKLTDLKRNLSASNLAALSDSNLSVQEAEPQRGYDAPNTTGSKAKHYLEQFIKRYYYQLTEGCGRRECRNKFCRSSEDAIRMTPDVAAIISIQLASSQRLYFCSSEKFIGRALPEDVFQAKNSKVKSFLQTLYSSSPFATLFKDVPQPESFSTTTNSAATNSNKNIATFRHSKSDLEKLGSGQPQTFPGQLKKNRLPVKLMRKPPTGRQSSPVTNLPPSGRHQLPGTRAGSNPSMLAQRVGSLGKLVVRDEREGAARRGGDVIRWGSDHSLQTGDTPDMPWVVDESPSRSRNCQMAGSGEDVSRGLLSRSNSGLQRNCGRSMNFEGGLHSRSLSSSQENLSLRGSYDNLVNLHYRSRTSPMGSTGNSLQMNSGGSALSLTSGREPSSLSSNPLSSLSPVASPTNSPIFSPAPSPMRLLSDQEALEETDDLREFERSLSLEIALDTGQEFALTHLTLSMLQVEENNPYSRLDLAAVKTAYNLLWDLHPRDRFMTCLANAIEILLRKLDQSLVQSHGINQLLIILECPLMELNFELVQVLCRIIAKQLVPGARTSLIQTLLHLDKERFQRLLKILKAHMVSMIRPNEGASEGMVHVAIAMQILYKANQIRLEHDASKGLAQLEDFYCHQLSRDLDYQTEYHRWQLKAGLPLQSPRDEFSPVPSLLDFPFLLDPASKVHVLHLDAVVQMRKEYQVAILHQARVNQAQKYLTDGRRFTPNLKDSIKAAMCPFLVLEVRRDYLISDTLAQIRLKKNDLKKPLKIKYIGGGEQGLDMGGLQKEFFQLISEAVFNPSYGMFVSSSENRTIWINGSEGSTDSDDEFELVGTLLGLAIYNGIILDVNFPMAIYKKLHEDPMTLEDLIGVQPSLGRGIREMLEYEGDVEDVFCQTFQVSYLSMGDILTVDLVLHGSQIPVTNQNQEEYARLYVKHLLIDSIARQFEAFARGFHSVCGGSALQLFQPSEIELLICGSPVLDFHALETSATYEDGFSRKHPTVLSLWRLIHSLSNEQKKKLLNFITGSDRVPLKGLSSLPIVIQRNGPDSERLPTAMTCFNRLLLPEYKDEKKLRERLLVAVQYGKGFGLT